MTIFLATQIELANKWTKFFPQIKIRTNSRDYCDIRAECQFVQCWMINSLNSNLEFWLNSKSIENGPKIHFNLNLFSRFLPILANSAYHIVIVMVEWIPSGCIVFILYLSFENCGRSSLVFFVPNFALLPVIFRLLILYSSLTVFFFLNPFLFGQHTAIEWLYQIKRHI